LKWKRKGRKMTITVSAPGKALIAGGYLVLESPNPGLVIATDSCFHVTIDIRSAYVHKSEQQQPANTQSVNDTIPGFHYCPLDVYSPQFHEIYSYWLRIYDTDKNNNDHPLIQLVPRYKNQPTNSYIEKTIVLSMSFVSIHYSNNIKQQVLDPQLFSTPQQQQQQSSKKAIAIQLRADNDFYSIIPHLKKVPRLPSNVASLQRFLPCPKDEEIHKTGLGSSAALVSSLVGAILTHFSITSLPSQQQQPSPPANNDNAANNHHQMIHNLAQICHSIAQGKIGSGFDVSAAIYGTHVYTRFNPNIIRQLMDDLTKPLVEKQVLVNLAERLYSCVMDKDYCWNSKVEPFTLPKGIELLMADVCGGSESPSMAKKVLTWKKKKQEEEKTLTATTNNNNEWKMLMQINQRLKVLFENATIQMKHVDNIPIIMKVLSSKRLEECFRLLDNNNKDEKCTILLDKLTNEIFVDALNDNTGKSNDASSSSAFQKDKDKMKQNLHDVILPILNNIRQTILQARKYLKQMGNAASVPIEPDEQSQLVNATMDIPGVLAAGVPGAGGYDALFVLYVRREYYYEQGDGIKDTISNITGKRKREGGKSISTATTDHVREEIGKFWLDWCARDNNNNGGGRKLVCPLACKSAGFGGLYGIHESKLTW